MISHRYLLLLLLFGCRPQQASVVSGAMPESTYVNYSADRLVLSEEARLAGWDSVTTQHRIDSLHRVYNVSEEQIKQATNEYQSDLPQWKGISDKIVRRLDQLQRTTGTTPDRKPFLPR